MCKTVFVLPPTGCASVGDPEGRRPSLHLQSGVVKGLKRKGLAKGREGRGQSGEGCASIAALEDKEHPKGIGHKAEGDREQAIAVRVQEAARRVIRRVRARPSA